MAWGQKVLDKIVYYIAVPVTIGAIAIGALAMLVLISLLDLIVVNAWSTML